jgi:bacteriorhodopsin
MSALVETTTKASVAIQLITGALSALGLTYTLPTEHAILTKLLGLELLVQGIELLFYFYFLVEFQLADLARKRYFDWVISTPIMLFTMAAYFAYKNKDETRNKEENKEGLSLTDFYLVNQKSLWIIWIANFAMLLFGYLGEIGTLEKGTAFALGSGAFLVSFYTLYDKFAQYSESSRTLFLFMFVLWSGYGGGYLFGNVSKNILFNGLDIVAKNFFGLFLYFQIQSLSQG